MSRSTRMAAITVMVGLFITMAPATSASAARAPFGNWESGTRYASLYMINGWAVDLDAEGGIAVDLYDDGPAGTAAFRYRTTGSRPDVNAAFGLQGTHGFQIPWRMTGAGHHHICLYAIGDSAPVNSVIGCRDVALPANPDSGPASRDLMGNLEMVSSPRSGEFQITGWVFDHRVPAGLGLTTTTAYATGRNEVGVQSSPIGYRPDVGAVFPQAGDHHGFDNTLKPDRSGEYTVCVYYNLDQRPELEELLGCRDITVAPLIGHIDTARYNRATNTLSATGWVMAPGHPGESATILGLINGTEEAENFAFFAPAITPRPDVNAALGVAGNYGFNVSEQLSFTPPSVDEFCIKVQMESRFADFTPCSSVVTQ